MKYSRGIFTALTLSSALLLGACATDSGYYNNNNNQPYGYTGSGYNNDYNSNYNNNHYNNRVLYGHVLDVRYVQWQERSNTSGVGIGIGAVAGGLLGNQIGSGSGRTAATVLGAVGGGVLGNEIGKRNSSPTNMDGLEIRVRLDNREVVTVTQPYRGENFQPGQNVRVINENGNWRVMY